MSIERTFDKLDEKISYLIRNLGLIITILFGFSAIIYNIFGLNLVALSVMIALFSLFLGNIIYSLHIYINKSSDIQKSVNENQLYEEFLSLCGDLTLRSSYHVRNIIKIYDELRVARRSEEGSLNLNERVEERLNFWKIDKDEQANYKLAVEDIIDYQKRLRFFIDIFAVMLIELQKKEISMRDDHINTLEQREKMIQEKKKKEDIISDFIESLRDFHSKIPRFHRIQLANNFYLTFNLNFGGNIIYKFEDFMNGFYNLVDKRHLENLRKLNDKNEEYEKRIKRCYKLYGFTIGLSIIILLIILITIASFQSRLFPLKLI